LKQKLQQTEDDRYNLSKKKDDLDKEFSNLQFSTSEEKDKAKREIDALIKKKIEDTERDLNDEISQLNQNKVAQEKKLRDKTKELVDLQKQASGLQAQKEQFEQSIKRIEDSLNSEQGDTLQEKKKCC